MSGDPSTYSPADDLPLPAQLGVVRGGGFDDIMSATKGVGAYIDFIGFGQKSSDILSVDDVTPLGIRYFAPTNSTCVNRDPKSGAPQSGDGATMYEYIDTVPKGDAFGPRINRALRDSRLPQLRGLAPGIMEDAKKVLNPMPLMCAMAGTGVARCHQVERPVGNARGEIAATYNLAGEVIKSRGGTPAWEIKGPIRKSGAGAFQKQWVFDQWVNVDGSPLKATEAVASDVPTGMTVDFSAAVQCNKLAKQQQQIEGFQTKVAAGGLIATLAVMAAVWTCW